MFRCTWHFWCPWLWLDFNYYLSTISHPALQNNCALCSYCPLLPSQVLQPQDLVFASLVASTPISLWLRPHGFYLRANSTANQAHTCLLKFCWWLLCGTDGSLTPRDSCSLLIVKSKPQTLASPGMWVEVMCATFELRYLRTECIIHHSFLPGHWLNDANNLKVTRQLSHRWKQPGSLSHGLEESPLTCIKRWHEFEISFCWVHPLRFWGDLLQHLIYLD